jgi:hypothetical protein
MVELYFHSPQVSLHGIVLSYLSTGTTFFNTVFWDVTPCVVVARYQRFGAICCLHLHTRLYPEDGGSLYLQNFGRSS